MPRKALNDKGEERYKGNPRNARALVGRRIGERRREMGLTQQVLGETLGVSRETISKYETGLLDLAAGDLPVLALKLRVPLMYFYQGLQQEPGWGMLASEVDYAQDTESVRVQTPEELKEAYALRKGYLNIIGDMGPLTHLEESMLGSYRRLVGEQQVTVYAMVLGLLEHSSGAGAPPPSRRVIARGMSASAAPEPALDGENGPTGGEKEEDATVAQTR